MKKIMFILAAAVLVICYGCSQNKKDDIAQIANPWSYFETLQEGEKKVGFELTYDVTDYEFDNCSVLNTELLQVELKADLDTVTIRKSLKETDIDGDYNNYSEEQSVNISGNKVTFKYNESLVYVMSWTTEQYNYIVYSETGLSQQTAEKIVESIR